MNNLHRAHNYHHNGIHTPLLSSPDKWVLFIYCKTTQTLQATVTHSHKHLHIAFSETELDRRGE